MRRDTETLSPSISKEEAAELVASKFPAQCGTNDRWSYYRFPKMYGSTAGPFRGVGGRAMTTFTIEAWHSDWGPAVIFFNGRIIAVTSDLVVQAQWEGER